MTISNALAETKNVESALLIFCEHYPISFATYHLAQTATLKQNVDAPFVKSTYPPEWIARYFIKGYIHIDPIAREGFLRALPFDWSEVAHDQASEQLLIDAVNHGLGQNGCSIPIVDKVERRALFSINSLPQEQNWESIKSKYLHEWNEIARVLHQKALHELYGDMDPVPKLSPRQLETLRWIAEGLNYKEIAIEMNVSEHTVRTYMEALRYKLGASSMTQVVSIASKLRLINT